MKTNKNLTLLADAPVPGALLKLGIPTMIGMLVSSLYNLVDSYFVGILGTSQQAAVSAVFPLSMIMLGIGLLFGSGAGSYLSRLLGNGQKKEADECASTALFTAVFTALILVIIMLLFINPLLKLLGCTPTMLPYATEYAIPFILGLVINVFNATMSNIATSEGASVYSMRSMLLGGAANMILDPVMIIGLHMGVFGAALATLISRLISFTSYLLFIFQKKSCFHFSLSLFHPGKKVYTEIAKIGVPNLLYQFLCSFVITLTNHFAALYGDAAVAAFGIVNRIITMGIMTVMGFLKGYQPFVGYNYGARNYERVHKATNLVLLWTTSFCFLLCFFMILFRIPIIRAFNHNDPAVIFIGSKALLMVAFTFLTVGFQLVYATKFMGLGKAKEGGLICLGRQGFFFIPLLLLLSAIFGLNGVIMSQPAADILSMILVTALAVKNHRQEQQLLHQIIL